MVLKISINIENINYYPERFFAVYFQLSQFIACNKYQAYKTHKSGNNANLFCEEEKKFWLNAKEILLNPKNVKSKNQGLGEYIL